jgi:hypothetical protein
MQWTFSRIINVEHFQMVLDFQLDAKYFHNKFMPQRYTKNIENDFWNNCIWIVMAFLHFNIYKKHFCLKFLLQTCYRDLEYDKFIKKTLFFLKPC